MSLTSWPIGDAPLRRLGIFEVTFQALGALLQLDGTSLIKIEGFPEGAAVLFVEPDNERGILRLYVEHESLPEVWEGSIIPVQSSVQASSIQPREVV